MDGMRHSMHKRLRWRRLTMSEEQIAVLNLQRYAPEALFQLYRDLNRILAEDWDKQPQMVVKGKINNAIAQSLVVFI